MSTSAHHRRTTSSAVLDRAVDSLEAKRIADVGLLVAAAEWAEANPAGPGVDRGAEAAGWGNPGDLFGEGFLPLAGEGAPLVAEFAPVALGAALGWTAAGAQLLMGDALELKWRLPRLWSLVLELEAPVHLARDIARHTRALSSDAARWADRLVSADPAPPVVPTPSRPARPQTYLGGQACTETVVGADGTSYTIERDPLRGGA